MFVGTLPSARARQVIKPLADAPDFPGFCQSAQSLAHGQGVAILCEMLG
jgi:hypothetical protein